MYSMYVVMWADQVRVQVCVWALVVVLIILRVEHTSAHTDVRL